jgi:cyclopropane fatty-acyl-phospholipid synthase-like methyltransferase
VLLSELGASGAKALSDLEILDVGCGSGGELLRLVSHGAEPARAHGVTRAKCPSRSRAGAWQQPI